MSFVCQDGASMAIMASIVGSTVCVELTFVFCLFITNLSKNK